MPRLSILTDKEQLEFDYPPTLNFESRAICFAIDDTLDTQIKKLRGETNKVGFLLQYAYFKASRRFFLIKRFREEDIEYACKLLDIRIRKVKLKKYKDRTPDIHREKILTLFNCKSYLTEKPWIEKEIILKVQRVVEPRALFFDVLHQMHSHQIEIPTYYALSELISDHYISYEKTLLDKIEAGMSDEQKKILQSLLSSTGNKYDTKILSYKTIYQSLKPKAIQANVKIFEQISDLITLLLPLMNSLALTPQCCEYYATWVKKAKISQLKQFTDERKLYLRLIAFLQHQYYSRQDIFIDILLRSVRSTKNSALHQLKNEDQLTRSERRTAVKHLTKSRQGYKSLIDEITEVTHSVVFTDTGKVQKIAELLQKHADEEKDRKSTR